RLPCLEVLWLRLPCLEFLWLRLPCLEFLWLRQPCLKKAVPQHHLDLQVKFLLKVALALGKL
ncbi:MAG: hypothetical protein OIF58_17095, partial [Cohaesibacter sp.]|nr:hypothetical protein [Cohaesibacter sp.]